MNQLRVGIALVTHNSSDFLRETLDSIEPQLAMVSAVQAVDDYSDDGTVDLLAEWVASLQARGIEAHLQDSTSVADDPRTRTAHNFTQAARALESIDLIALADHDDIWLPARLDRHVSLMVEQSDALMLAGNGTLMGREGTLFDAFDVPEGMGSWPCERIARYVIRHSVATGGASMIRSDMMQMPEAAPPAGWLHDRWWSLLAASRCGFLVDRKPVIDYRVSDDQQVGLDRGRQSTRGLARLSSGNVSDIGKLKDLLALRRNARGAARRAFTPVSVVRSLSI